MNTVVLYHEPPAAAGADEHDVLAQRDAVADALRHNGHVVSRVGCSLDFQQLAERLEESTPDVVFNLVESLAGTDRLMPMATLLLDALQVCYTGASTAAIFATSNKHAAKEVMERNGLPTPAWIVSAATLAQSRRDRRRPTRCHSHRWILKPIWEHASVGMDDAAVVEISNPTQLEAIVTQRELTSRRPQMAEQFIDGREFNLSLLNGEVLPAAEIDFAAFPPDKPRIVGHRAKWDPASFEYQQTPRRFDFPSSDAALVAELQELSRDCWSLFNMTGYARVDFRVDPDGQPWILEINANPCLTPDAGFAAALTQAGIPYQDAIRQIVDVAVNSIP